MAEFALFVGWGSPKVGREAAAAKLWDETVAFGESLKAAGEIESIEQVILGLHGGDLSGFSLLRGDPDKLARLSMSPEFQRIAMRASVLLESVGIVSAVVDGGAMKEMAAWKVAIADLT